MGIASRDERLKWFKGAKLGLFIHWGPYSVAGVEASWPIMAPDLVAAAFGPQPRIGEDEYRSLAARFHPEQFDASAWVRAARQAGARYIVFTAKHHDGYCLFDAPGTHYKITHTPFRRDICAELADACAAQRMPLGFYYSPPDMHHPAYRDTRRPAVQNWLGEPRRPEWPAYLDYMEGHLRQLLTAYGDVCLIWFDGLSGHHKYDPPRFFRLIHELSPTTLVNDRLGPGGDYITAEQFIPRDGIPVRQERPAHASDGQFRAMLSLLKVPGIRSLVQRAARRYAEGTLNLSRVAQARVPSPAQFQPWETCLTMNRSWAYNPLDTGWKPLGLLARCLVEVASRGGNLLLNVGPTPEGAFPAPALERLQGLGEWLAAQGPAFYGTSYGSLQGLPYARSTAAAGTVFLHLLDVPRAAEIVIEGVSGAVTGVSLVDSGRPLEYAQAVGHLSIRLSPTGPGALPRALAIQIAPQG